MTETPLDADHFTYRVLRDAMNDATGAYWRRRAAGFRAALPSPNFPTSGEGLEKHGERFARLTMIVENCEHRATLADESLTEVEQQLIHDEFDRTTALHRYMRQADRAATLWQLRILWRDAQQAGRLDVQLARHFDACAKGLKATAATDHREALQIDRSLAHALQAGAA